MNLLTGTEEFSQHFKFKAEVSKIPPPKCFCGECDSEMVYVCFGCKRQVPWCFGADDSLYDYCDDCVFIANNEVNLNDSMGIFEIAK